MPPSSPTGVAYDQVVAVLSDAYVDLFGADPRVRAVGITQSLDGGFALGVIRNAAAVLPQKARASIQTGLFLDFRGVPVLVRDATGDPTTLARMPARPQDRPLAAARVPERAPRRPLACGLEVQNLDDDLRQDLLPDQVTIGTLGGFVRLPDGRPAILSNNHVLAGENRGKRRRDRILQPGRDELDDSAHVATLHQYASLRKSRARASAARDDVTWNTIDAAVALLRDDVPWSPRYLPTRRSLPAPTSWGPLKLGDAVFKVGRTTGLTHGRIVETTMVVGPVGYDFGPCWFRGCFAIESTTRGKPFSDGGDSGSLIVKPSGEAVGLLFAGDGTYTYACDLGRVLAHFKATLATAP